MARRKPTRSNPEIAAIKWSIVLLILTLWWAQKYRYSQDSSFLFHLILVIVVLGIFTYLGYGTSAVRRGFVVWAACGITISVVYFLDDLQPAGVRYIYLAIAVLFLAAVGNVLLNPRTKHWLDCEHDILRRIREQRRNEAIKKQKRGEDEG
ncbi:MAG: hypothetical protein AAF591_00520 [Verrucomicrobiota bacterium]